MAIDLSNLNAPEPNKLKKKRIGRGEGSGRGGHTVGRGHNGQLSRSGYKVRFWFEGGQMPLQRRIPKFGFTNNFRTSYVPLNVESIEYFVRSGKLESPISIDDLREAGIIGKNDLVKLLGRGEIETGVEIEVHAHSESGREKVERAGGSVTVVEE